MGTATGTGTAASRALTIAARAGAGVLAAGAAAAAWGVLVERGLFAVRRVRFPVLDPGSRPIRVLHLSDLHLAPWQLRKMRWVRSLAELKPDLVVDTGDNFGHPAALFGLQFVFDAFRGVPGAYVHGSNDYFAPIMKNPLAYLGEAKRVPKMKPGLDTAGLESFLSGELGWANLNNSAGRAVVRGTTIDLVGVNDPHRHFDRIEHAAQALELLRGSGQEPEGPRLTIGVAHAPYRRTLDQLLELGADVLFAGHTHGGQVRVPGGAAIVTNCDIPRWQASGPSLWTQGHRAAPLNVSAGIGTSIFAPVRFGVRPEATLVTLSPRSES